jgi:hypothetical protein
MAMIFSAEQIGKDARAADKKEGAQQSAEQIKRLQESSREAMLRKREEAIARQAAHREAAARQAKDSAEKERKITELKQMLRPNAPGGHGEAPSVQVSGEEFPEDDEPTHPGLRMPEDYDPENPPARMLSPEEAATERANAQAEIARMERDAGRQQRGKDTLHLGPDQQSVGTQILHAPKPTGVLGRLRGLFSRGK